MTPADHLGPFPQVGKVVALSVSSVAGASGRFMDIRGHLDLLRQRQGQGCIALDLHLCSVERLAHSKGKETSSPASCFFPQERGLATGNGTSQKGGAPSERSTGETFRKGSPLSLRWTSGQAHTEIPLYSHFPTWERTRRSTRKGLAQEQDCWTKTKSPRRHVVHQGRFKNSFSGKGITGQ